MSKQTRPPSQPNGGHSAVGYGKPPVHTRFKKGQSGNPKGRRKGQRNVHTVVDEALSQRITIREGNRTRSVTKLDAVILTMVAAALRRRAQRRHQSSGVINCALALTGYDWRTAGSPHPGAVHDRRSRPDRGLLPTQRVNLTAADRQRR